MQFEHQLVLLLVPVLFVALNLKAVAKDEDSVSELSFSPPFTTSERSLSTTTSSSRRTSSSFKALSSSSRFVLRATTSNCFSGREEEEEEEGTGEKRWHG